MKVKFILLVLLFFIFGCTLQKRLYRKGVYIENHFSLLNIKSQYNHKNNTCQHRIVRDKIKPIYSLRNISVKESYSNITREVLTCGVNKKHIQNKKYIKNIAPVISTPKTILNTVVSNSYKNKTDNYPENNTNTWKLQIKELIIYLITFIFACFYYYLFYLNPFTFLNITFFEGLVIPAVLLLLILTFLLPIIGFKFFHQLKIAKKSEEYKTNKTVKYFTIIKLILLILSFILLVFPITILSIIGNPFMSTFLAALIAVLWYSALLGIIYFITWWLSKR